MTDLEIKQFISVNVLSNIQDGSKEIILRSILFDSKNNINWQSALNSTLLNMPELQK